MDFKRKREILSQPPPFQLYQLRKKIPRHCWEKSTLTGLLYVVANVSTSVVLFALAHSLASSSTFIAPLTWTVYTLMQGFSFFGMYTLTHEALHGNISPHWVINDFIGVLLFSFLFGPFYPWRKQHVIHHKTTNRTEEDPNFAPTKRSDVVESWNETLENMWAYNFGRIVYYLGTAPYRLILKGVGVPKLYRDKVQNFYSPKSMYRPKKPWKLYASVLPCFMWMLLWMFLGLRYSMTLVTLGFVLPYIFVGAIVGTVALLHHTDVYIPHFSGDQGFGIQGSLCGSVDRSFGYSLLDFCSHHAFDCHICHHLFPSIPFYHIQEATMCLKGELGEYYTFDSTPLWKALWRAMKFCKFVEDTENVAFYKHSLT